MTKIFITIPWFLPAFKAGGPVQSVANLVKEFHEGVEFLIFCGDVDLNGAELQNITANQWTQFNDHTRVWYAGPEKISDTLVKLVEKEKPDLLFIIGMFSWHYNIVPLMFCKGTKKILSTRGMLHPGALAQKKWKKRAYLQLFKLLEYHYKVSFHATDKEEAGFIRNFFGEVARVFVAGNFPNKLSPLPVPPKEKNSLILTTIALISPMKNVRLVLEALGSVTAEVQYDIYGPVKDEEYWEACREKIKLLPSNIKVTYKNALEPANIIGALQESHVFILPSKSENFGHAIVEALSAGRPVITSHFTPWKNLKEQLAGINVSIEGTEELSHAISFFAAMDQEEMEEWGRGATQYSQKSIDVKKIKEDYGKMFSHLSS
ncbi:glycosyltransferase [Hanamia caeni]|uniref:Glycosyltransferase n=1 Tax=Hanamia caeni TaxID=2294116 RepID=A0A3M9N354_9BACT|nr:glycosyltransferase [Hanamia caeni]RNI32166.1 glycosyltransferase [Hanamia caeni]